LRAEQLLGRGSAFLEDLLRVVGHLDRDRLETLRPRPEGVHGGIHVVLPELLHILEILDHLRLPFPGRVGRVLPWVLISAPAGWTGCLTNTANILQCTIMSRWMLHRSIKNWSYTWQYVGAAALRSNPEPALNALAIPLK